MKHADDNQILVERMRELLGPMDPIPTETPAELNPLPGIRCICFDIYGTLLTSGSGDVGTAEQADRTSALAEAIAATGLEGDPAVAAREGMPRFFEAIHQDHATARANSAETPEIEVREIWRLVLDQLGAAGIIRGPIDARTAARLAVEYECRANPVWPMPGMEAVLHAVVERRLPLGIVSNAQFFTPLLFEALLNRTTADLGFEEPLCGWSYRLRESKPSARIFAPVLDELAARGIAVGDTLYIGNDMRNDIWTAQRCGMKTVLFAGDRRSLRLREDDANCRDVQPNAIITALDQLPGLLAQ